MSVVKARELVEFIQLTLQRILPTELGNIILEFVLPATHPDWRRGGSFPSYLFYDGLNDDYYEGPFPIALALRFNEALFDSNVEESEYVYDFDEFDYSQETFEQMLGGFDLY